MAKQAEGQRPLAATARYPRFVVCERRGIWTAAFRWRLGEQVRVFQHRLLTDALREMREGFDGRPPEIVAAPTAAETAAPALASPATATFGSNVAGVLAIEWDAVTPAELFAVLTAQRHASPTIVCWVLGCRDFELELSLREAGVVHVVPSPRNLTASVEWLKASIRPEPGWSDHLRQAALSRLPWWQNRGLME